MTRRFPRILVGSTVAVGLVVTLISLYSNRIRWDRETAVAAAKYDGEALINLLSGLPGRTVDYREIDSGPLTPDLSNVREAWITWKESFSTETDFPGVVEAYRSKLAPLSWNEGDRNDAETVSFQNGEWTLTLTGIPAPAASPAIYFRRLIGWQTPVP